MQLTTNWQQISSAGLISNVTISLEGRYTSQNISGNYTDAEFRIVNYASNSARWRTASGTVNFTGAFTDSGSCATYPNYVNNETILLTISKRIYHNDDGSKTISLGGHVDALFGGTRYNANPPQTSITLPSIARYPVLTNATDFNDEQNPTIYFTTALGFTGATVSTTLVDPNTGVQPPGIAWKNIPDVSLGYYTYNLTTAERNSLRAWCNTTNSKQIYFVLLTEAGGVQYWSTPILRTLTIVNADPIVGDNDYTKAETNTKVSTVLNSTSADKVVQNASVVRYTITPVLPKTGSTITSVSLKHNNVIYYTTKSGNSYIADIPIQTQTIDIYVKDSRGNPTNNLPVKTITIANANFIEYSPVKIGEYSFKRVNATSSNININLDSTYWSATFRTGVSNEPTVKYKKDDGSFITIPSSAYSIDSTNHRLTIYNYLLQNDLVYTASATYTIKIEDLLSEAQNTYKVTKGIPTFDAGEFDLKVNGELYIAGRDGSNAQEIRDLIYPVGSIYLSVNNVNPRTLFGGEWEAFGTGRTLVGVDTSQTEFNSVEKTGGSKDLQNHTHTINTMLGFAEGSANVKYTVGWGYTRENTGITTDGAGTGNSGNLQPYITVYMWKRTA